MTKRSLPCEDVRRAVWARLDAETATIANSDIDEHVSACPACLAAITAISRLNRDLARLEYERLEVDLWTRLEPDIAGLTSREGHDHRVFLALGVVLVAWRLGQLLLDLPAPVVNSIVPLASVALVLWRLAGDPFALRASPHYFRQERLS